MYIFNLDKWKSGSCRCHLCSVLTPPIAQLIQGGEVEHHGSFSGKVEYFNTGFYGLLSETWHRSVGFIFQLIGVGTGFNKYELFMGGKSVRDRVLQSQHLLVGWGTFFGHKGKHRFSALDAWPKQATSPPSNHTLEKRHSWAMCSRTSFGKFLL